MSRVSESCESGPASQHGGTRYRCRSGAAVLALTATLISLAASAGDHPFRVGNGPGPGPNGPGPGCNLIPALASTGTKVDSREFPRPDSVAVDPRLAGPVQFLRSGKYD